ncbi:MAG: hypothetical protein ACK5L6_13515 [Anaerorhabdus sp.]|uniref:hypothetical protein n=1 Tax=Anaerorhabdus sp. TaxID=1872524 RepID=UPI003A839C88
MSWQLLPVNYKDAIWNGLKKFIEVQNEDGTVSFDDVTQYTNKEYSFFGALDANRMNEALNTIMSMVENGTNLYEAFQNYFALQKTLFENQANLEYAEFESYVAQLKVQGDNIINILQTEYRDEMNQFEFQQQALFEVWFQTIKGKLSEDIAGSLQNQIDNLTEKEFNHHYGLVNKVTNVNKDDTGATLNIVELGDNVLATTTFAEVDSVKTITTELVPTAGSFKYTKTVVIETVPTGKKITENYTKGVK